MGLLERREEHVILSWLDLGDFVVTGMWSLASQKQQSFPGVEGSNEELQIRPSFEACLGLGGNTCICW